jgi:hypothetical protein
MQIRFIDFDAETAEASAMLTAYGCGALQKASDEADSASSVGNHERAAYWRRVTAFIAGLSREWRN